MPAGTGLDSFLKYAVEATYGIDPTASYQYLRIVSSSFRRQSTLTQGNRSLGRLIRGGVRKYARKASGDITVDLEYEGAESLLEHMFGSRVQTGDGSALPYTHTITATTARQVGLHFFQNQDVTRQIFPGVKLTGWRLVITQENLNLVLTGVGLPGTADLSIDTPTFLDVAFVLPLEEDPANGFEFLLDDTPVEIESAELSGTLAHAEDRISVGQRDIKEPIPNDFMEMTGSITVEHADNTWNDIWLANTRHKMEFNFKSEDFIPGVSPDAEYQFKVELPEVVPSEANASIDGPAALVEEIPFTAAADASASPITIVIDNGLDVDAI